MQLRGALPAAQEDPKPGWEPSLLSPPLVPGLLGSGVAIVAGVLQIKEHSCHSGNGELLGPSTSRDRAFLSQKPSRFLFPFPHTAAHALIFRFLFLTQTSRDKCSELWDPVHEPLAYQ